MENNRVTTYLLYALGEILLVVIGILIAVSINNWNQAKKDSQERQTMLQNLQLENLYNIERLKEDQKNIGDAIYSATRVLRLIADEEIPDQKTSDSLIYEILSMPKYVPSRGALLDITNSGKINLIRDDSLRTLLLSFSGMIDDVNDLESRAERSLTSLFYPYLMKHQSFANMDAQLNQFRKIDWPAGRFDSDVERMYNSREFQSLADDHLWRSMDIENHYNDIFKHLSLIDALIEEEMME